MAKLYFRYSCMNAGKSTQLLQVAHNYESQGMKVLLLKPSLDTKGSDKIISRLGVERKVDHLIKEHDNIQYIVKDDMKDLACILVDEVQFLKEHHINELFDIAVRDNIPVICYGLRTDVTLKGFEGSVRLLCLAHKIEELKTICDCGNKAIVHLRKINGEYNFKEGVVVDDKDEIEYLSVCGKCYLNVMEELIEEESF